MPRLRRHSWITVAVAILCLAATAWSAAGGRLQTATPVAALPLPAGWNLVADPGGIVSSGPAYTYQMGDTAYETVAPGTPLVPGLGYWVAATSYSALPLAAGSPRATIMAPAGQWVMVGDPSGILPAQVSGADIVLGFDPRGGYQQIDDGILGPGQGAFALSVDGGSITLVAFGDGPTPPCSLADTGSACAVNGACPAGYPIAITQDAFAHLLPGVGDAPIQGTIVLCFNAATQAAAAGYHLAPSTRIVVNGPASATTSNIRVTVLRALLESPEAFMARVAVSADQVCGGCDVTGATGIVTVEYGVENINRPATLVTTGRFVSEHQPAEGSPAYYLLASQSAIDPVHNGSPTGGSVSGVFTHVNFGDIDKVVWRLDNPFIDATNSVPQPHGPNLSFELAFRGPQAGQMIAYGIGSTPLSSYDPGAAGPSVSGYGTLVTIGNPAPVTAAAPAPQAGFFVPAQPALAPGSPASITVPVGIPQPGTTANPQATPTGSTTGGGITTLPQTQPTTSPNAPFTR